MFEPDPSVLEELPRADRFLEIVDGELLESSEPERRALGWTLAVAAQQQAILEAAREVEGFAYSAAGFLDPEVDRAIAEEYGSQQFGVILYAETLDTEPDRDRLRFLEIQDLDAVLPVVVRRGTFEPHIPALRLDRYGPFGGQLACWVTTRGGRRWGWLTAKHVAPLLGRVVDSAPHCTDAAVVDNHVPKPPGVTSISSALIRHHMAVVVSMLTRPPPLARVLDVSTDFGMLSDPRFPVRFNMSVAGQPGDSGGLISTASSNQPAGVYLGAFTTPSGARSGVGLATYQLERMLDMEIYQ